MIRMMALVGAIVTVAGLGVQSANAGGFVSVDVGWGGGGWCGPSYYCPPTYYYPPSVVYVPPPVYYGGYGCSPYVYGYGSRYYGGYGGYYGRGVAVDRGRGDYRWRGGHDGWGGGGGSGHHGRHHGD
jgi:hypothetical protein